MRNILAIVFIGASISMFGSPVRSTIGGKSISFLGAEGNAIYTAADYVQEGLAALWDGIENLDWETHDDSVGYWADLVRGRKLETGGSAWTWTEDSLLTEKCGFSIEMSDCLFFRDTFTIEYVWTVKSIGYAQYFWCVTSAYSSYVRYAGLGTAITLYYNVMCNGAANNAGFTNTDIVWHVGDKLHMSVVYSMTEGICQIFINGEYVKTGSGAGYVDPSSAGISRPVFVIGGATRTGDTAASIMTHCARIYSRALSPEEIKENYVVDKARFGL